MSNSDGLHAAARNGDLAQLGKCLSENVDVNATDKHQRTALHLAAWAGHADVAKALLSTPGIQKKACAMDQMTALHFGAMNGHTEVCRLLLNAGIPVNTKTRKALTPLHFACQKGHEDTVHMLLKRKAAPYLKDSKGENALDKCKNSEACRAAVQAAMDAAAASGTAFSKKRGRKDGEEGDDGKAEGNAGDGKHQPKGGDSSGDDDEEEDIIPLKRPLVAPKPAPKQPQQPQASSPIPSAKAETTSVAGGQPEATTAGAPANDPPTESAKPLQAADGNTPACRPPVAKPPVAAPMRPPVARGPSRGIQSGKDGRSGGPG